MSCLALRKLRPLLLAILAAVIVGVPVTPSTVFTASARNIVSPYSAGIDQPARTPQVTSPDPNEVVSSEQQTEADQRAVEEFWTEERMASAAPADMPPVSDPQPGNNADVPPPDGPEYLAYSDENGQPQVHIGPRDGVPAAGAPQPLAGTFPFSYTRYRLFPDLTSIYQTYPNRTIGKFFFTILGSAFFCSASSVVSQNFSVVWTAGHCVFTPGIGFNANFLFAPARRLLNNPYGTWTARTAFTLNGWTQGFLEFDHGAIVANRGGTTNERIGDRVGSLNFLANASRMQHWHLFGYPAPDPRFPPVNPPFDGEHQEICAATWATNDMGFFGPPTIGVGCDQTGGASGGPWIVDYSGLPSSGTQVFNLLNGNNSYKYLAPNHLRVYGPYFTTGAINLLTAASNVEVP
jgi:V8-like Glu-specific endopeptidase